ILTLVILVTMRLCLHATDRFGAKDLTASAALHHIILRGLLRFLIWIVAILGVAASWGANLPAFFATPIGQRVLGGTFSIGITIAVVALIYGLCNSAIESRLNRRDADGKVVQASARMRTLLPMLRNTVFIIFAIAVGIVVLSELGFNIAPLLAGAGIFGVALGFGSQTLVKDFLTGLFIVIENTIAIGDVVKIGDHSGVVDAMSVRTLRLRDNDGAVHILPYSEVTNIINMTKDFAFAVIDVGVGYDADLEKAMQVIREVGDDMQKDPIFKRVILEQVEVLGIEKLGDSSITIRSRIRTRPGKQWDVRRMFQLKLVQRFIKEGIDIPFPTVTNIQRTLPPSQ
ncbi:MAG TPA: mechanosensitive ion channel domain-containing protein, partial [Alphaproteobacteria bacterium]|nr:mechanosensitive ion channel domain-containing protein [Alphaproteobacteria bacterium]